MNVKELKKLAAACRKAGIKTYKCGDVEFTLTEDEPQSAYKLKKTDSKPADNFAPDTNFESDSLTEEQLLFWSSGGPAESLLAEDDK